MEEWRDVVGYEGLYEVSNYVWEHGGDVFERFIRENRARTLKQEIERPSEELSQIETPTQNP